MPAKLSKIQPLLYQTANLALKHPAKPLVQHSDSQIAVHLIQLSITGLKNQQAISKSKAVQLILSTRVKLISLSSANKTLIWLISHQSLVSNHARSKTSSTDDFKGNSPSSSLSQHKAKLDSLLHQFILLNRGRLFINGLNHTDPLPAWLKQKRHAIKQRKSSLQVSSSPLYWVWVLGFALEKLLGWKLVENGVQYAEYYLGAKHKTALMNSLYSLVSLVSMYYKLNESTIEHDFLN